LEEGSREADEAVAVQDQDGGHEAQSVESREKTKKRKLSPQEFIVDLEKKEHELRMQLLYDKIEHEGIEHTARMNNIQLEKTMIQKKIDMLQ
jgi:hypothetical protein